jgi:NAD dependent epimerase/dehydratase family enzyme
MEKKLPVFSTGHGGVLGSGSQWMSWIHQDDLTNMFTYFIDHPKLTGAFNAVAPHPVTNKEFSQTLAKALGTWLFLPVPAPILKIALGGMSTLVLDGQKVSSKKILETGFSFKFKNLEDALIDICSPLKSGQSEFFAEVWLPRKVQEVFPFFSDEKNLEKLTPGHLNFNVLKKSTPEI